MSPELKVDKISPPPARLSAFLYHMPSSLFSIILFFTSTSLLVFSGILWLGRAETNIETFPKRSSLKGSRTPSVMESHYS